MNSLSVHTRRLIVVRIYGGGEYMCGRQGSLGDVFAALREPKMAIVCEVFHFILRVIY
jgi:hypothetical protein